MQSPFIIHPSVDDDFLFRGKPVKQTIALVKFGTEPVPIIFSESVPLTELWRVWITRDRLSDVAVDGCEQPGGWLFLIGLERSQVRGVRGANPLNGQLCWMF